MDGWMDGRTDRFFKEEKGRVLLLKMTSQEGRDRAIVGGIKIKSSTMKAKQA